MGWYTIGMAARLLRFAILVAGLGCGAEDDSGDPVPDLPVSDAGDAATEDLAPVPTDLGGTEDAEPAPDVPPLEPIVVQLRATSLGVLPPGEGFDLDGDAAPDNALAALFENPDVAGLLGGDPNGFLAKEIDDGDLNLLLDFLALHHVKDDAQVELDLMLGKPAVKGGYDVLCESLGEDGAPLSHFDTGSVSEGIFESGVGQFRFALSFAGDTVLTFRNARLTGELANARGVAGSGLSGGRLGGVLLLSELAEVLENDPEVGGEFVQLIMIYLQTVADIDTDDDGTPDAMSAGFFLTADATQVNRSAPCVE